MLHYCIDDENSQVASACGQLFSKDSEHLTREASAVWCTNCMRWMKKRGILPGDRGKLAKIVVHLEDEERAALAVMSADANVTHAELLRQLLRRAIHDRDCLLEPGQE